MMDDESAIVNIEFGFHFGIMGMCSDRKPRRGEEAYERTEHQKTHTKPQ